MKEREHNFKMIQKKLSLLFDYCTKFKIRSHVVHQKGSDLATLLNIEVNKM